MSRGRTIALFLVLVLTGAVVVHLSNAKPRTEGAGGAGSAPSWPTNPRPIALTRSEECRPCHAEVFEEWRASHHAIAYTNPEVQDRSKGFQDKDCLPCHLPRPVLETGLGAVRVLERVGREEDGVDCFACHHDPHGNVMIGTGPLGDAAKDAPCQPVATPVAGSMSLCSPCHNLHKVHEDWKETVFARPGEGYRECNDCHMPVVERSAAAGRPARKGRSHRFPGAHDPEMLKSAAEIRVEVAGAGTLLVTVRNVGAGHAFPADERHRAVDLDLEVRFDDGRVGNLRIDRYRNPYRQEFDLKNPLREPGAERSYSVPIGETALSAEIHAVRVPADYRPKRTVWFPESTQIPSGEARSYTVRLPETATRATVRLRYRIQPFQTDAEATLLHESTHVLR